MSYTNQTVNALSPASAGSIDLLRNCPQAWLRLARGHNLPPADAGLSARLLDWLKYKPK
jgi:hypothetical protein